MAVLSVMFITTACNKNKEDFQEFSKVLLDTTPRSIGGAGALQYTVCGVDVNGDDRADGLALDCSVPAASRIPLLLFVPPFSPLTGVDVDGNGAADYYLQYNDDDTMTLFTRADGGGNTVQIISDKGTTPRPIGFDTNRDCQSGETHGENNCTVENFILARINGNEGNAGYPTDFQATNPGDTTPPNALSNILSGAYAAPIDVTFECSDNVACNSVAYVFNSMGAATTDCSTYAEVPEFNLTNMNAKTGLRKGIEAGNAYTISLGNLPLGKYCLKFIARDAANNTSAVIERFFTIGEPATIIPGTITRKFISTNVGAYGSSSITWTADKAGNYHTRIGGRCSESDPGAYGTPAPTPFNTNTTIVSAATLAATNGGVDGLRNLLVCFKSSDTGIVTSQAFELFLDNTVPVAEIVPNGGIYATAQNVRLQCDDASSCETMTYIVGPNSGASPANPDFSGSQSSGNLVAGTIYSTPNSTFTIPVGPEKTASDPDPTEPYRYTVKIRVKDLAGNNSTIVQATFALGGTFTPNITVNTNPRKYVRAEGGLSSNGISSTTIAWQSDFPGTYVVRIRPSATAGDTCTVGTQSTGSNASGSVLANQSVTSTILASDLTLGANEIKVCFDASGYSGEAARTIYRVEVENALTANVTLFERDINEAVSIDLKQIFRDGTAGATEFQYADLTRYTTSIDSEGTPTGYNYNATTKTVSYTAHSQPLTYIFTGTLQTICDATCASTGGYTASTDSYGPVQVLVYVYQDKTKVVHVDAGAGGGGNGSRATPYNTLTAALSAATTLGGGDIYMKTTGTYSTSTVTIPNGVSIYGGYKNASAAPHTHTWVRDTTSGNRSVIMSGASATGLILSSISQDLTLSGLSIATTNAGPGDSANRIGLQINGTSNGVITLRKNTIVSGNADTGSTYTNSPSAPSSYGIHAVGVTGALVVAENTITAGRGAHGDSGTVGSNGVNNTNNGGNGGNGTDNGSSGGNGGTAGAAVDNGGIGGRGGRGGHDDPDPCSGNGQPGNEGSCGGLGERGSTNSSASNTWNGAGSGRGGARGGEDGGTFCDKGGTGGGATSGATGSAGSHASQNGTAFGNLTSFFIVPTHGLAGAKGGGGQGGGGGGGGGNGGTGGFGGGASVAILLANIANATIQDNTLNRAQGGNGGIGAQGGTGGTGAGGGNGGGGADDGAAGGPGAGGGQGGQGGSGSGGNGGPSFGIAFFSSTMTVSGTTYNGGSGGAAGTSANGGNAGIAGLNSVCFQYTGAATGATRNATCQ